MIEYKDWAKQQLSNEHEPAREDWVGMSVGEMADRASALCAEARKNPLSLAVLYAFQSLEKMVEVMKEKYPRRD